MGEYFIVANPRKRQYVSASHFDGNVKCHCRLQNWAARATGLGEFAVVTPGQPATLNQDER